MVEPSVDRDSAPHFSQRFCLLVAEIFSRLFGRKNKLYFVVLICFNIIVELLLDWWLLDLYFLWSPGLHGFGSRCQVPQQHGQHLQLHERHEQSRSSGVSVSAPQQDKMAQLLEIMANTLSNSMIFHIFAHFLTMIGYGSRFFIFPMIVDLRLRSAPS